MAGAALRQCNEPGCNSLARHARCDRHRRERARPTKAKRARDNFYSRAAWRKLRAAYKAANPCCERCLAMGRAAPAVDIHHKKSRREQPELELDWGNLEALCKPCHSSETGRERSKGGGGGVNLKRFLPRAE